MYSKYTIFECLIACQTYIYKRKTKMRQERIRNYCLFLLRKLTNSFLHFNLFRRSCRMSCPTPVPSPRRPRGSQKSSGVWLVTWCKNPVPSGARAATAEPTFSSLTSAWRLDTTTVTLSVNMTAQRHNAAWSHMHVKRWPLPNTPWRVSECQHNLKRCVGKDARSQWEKTVQKTTCLWVCWKTAWFNSTQAPWTRTFLVWVVPVRVYIFVSAGFDHKSTFLRVLK